ncbi:MAG: hypothetical protein JSW50_07655, partial [Candidatus Latescibacterota bacterium]
MRCTAWPLVVTLAAGFCLATGTAWAADDFAKARQLYDDGWWNDARDALETLVENGATSAEV